MGIEATFIMALSFALLGYGVFWFLHRNDEIPVVLAMFNFMFCRRLFNVAAGIASWSDFDYNLDFVFDDYSLQACSLLLGGAIVLTASYCFFSKVETSGPSQDNMFFAALLRRNSRTIIGGFVVFFVLNLILRGSYTDDAEITNSYAYLFTLANSAFILLLYLLVRNLRTQLATRVIAFGAIAIAGYFSISPTMRFGLLGWAITLSIMMTSSLRPQTRMAVLGALGLGVGLLFSTVGLLRHEEYQTITVSELFDDGINAMVVGNDANMLDGFIMVMQVYPARLDYSYGKEHLDILTRPIPRAIWPDKPVGGWHQKLAQASGGAFYGTGISSSLYGSFYAEGGVIGVVVCAALYGYFFARYVNWANRHGSTIQWMLRGILVASLFALIRGGDLPGIVAFIGMSFWPIVIALYMYKRFLLKQGIGTLQRQFSAHQPGRENLNTEGT